ncbi:hypothetical protein E3N88_09487 [Mikania micrantha]|uniref:Uncharacterized protein n=1 Tax=Mikania micrantha TaxID=192012 RepID=A0A5N6PL58_9ASTR|nr:hypothetical protein E3N88_09487 [Mikania micrantha]
MRREAKFFKIVVTEILLALHVINLSIDEKLVDIGERVKNVISSLEVESEDDVRVIGIWGMGGAGKTALARAVFDHISIVFEGKSFVENVRECSKGMGLKELQKQVLKDVLNDQSIDVTSVSDGINKMKKMMAGRKVLVVLDDVDDIYQLEALAEEDQKEIFLDVACILKGEPKENAIRILESCGFHAQNGLKVLEQKSLINISSYGCLGMHDHIEEMGRNIVCGLNPREPNKQSRLWVKEEIEEILINNLGTKATKSMILKDMDIHPAVVMKGLRKMKNIIFLSVNRYLSPKMWEIDEGGVQYLPDTLRSLIWVDYPFFCLPKTFQANNLVYLKMPRSYISQLWEGGERKVLELKDCYYLKEIHVVGRLKNLTRLNLSGCLRFEYFWFYTLRVGPLPMDLGGLECLEELNLSNCVSLRSIPDSICQLKCLKELDLSHCRRVEKLPEELGRVECLKELKIEGAGISRLPESIFQLKDLRIIGSAGIYTETDTEDTASGLQLH